MSEKTGLLPSKEQFKGQVNSIFAAHPNSGNPFELVLVSVDEHVSNDVQENFSLVFRAPQETPPVQEILRVEHETLGTMEIFVVPVRQDGQGLYFEAVFNLVTSGGRGMET